MSVVTADQNLHTWLRLREQCENNRKSGSGGSNELRINLWHWPQVHQAHKMIFCFNSPASLQRKTRIEGEMEAESYNHWGEGWMSRHESVKRWKINQLKAENIKYIMFIQKGQFKKQLWEAEEKNWGCHESGWRKSRPLRAWLNFAAWISHLLPLPASPSSPRSGPCGPRVSLWDNEPLEMNSSWQVSIANIILLQGEWDWHWI